MVLGREESPEQVGDLIDGAGAGAQRLAEGHQIVVEVAVVEYVNTEDGGIDVPLALFDQEAVLGAGALALGCETCIVIRVGLGVGEDLVH